MSSGNLTPEQMAELARWGLTPDDITPAVVPTECYERERNRATAAEARIATLEADLEQWRNTVDNPQIQAIRDDARKVAERQCSVRIAKLKSDLARETNRANYLMHLLENVERVARGEDPLPNGVRIVEIQTDGTNGGAR